jgi:hypothetical protein
MQAIVALIAAKKIVSRQSFEADSSSRSPCSGAIAAFAVNYFAKIHRNGS